MPNPADPPKGGYVVTGAGGFIGSHLIRRLLDAGCEVIAADLTPPAVLPRGASYVRVDLRDRATVRRALAGLRPNYAIHLAAKVGDWGPRDDFEAINVLGARALLEAVCDAGVTRALHVSSIAAMGFDAGAHADETAEPVGARDAYSDTKAAGERAARALIAQGAPITVVRPGDVYGVGCVPWVRRPIELLRTGRMVLVEGGRGHFAHVHVENLLDGMLLALGAERARGEVFIVTDDAECTVGEYFTRLADVCDLPRPRWSLPRRAAEALAAGFELTARATGTAPPFSRAAIGYVLRRGGFSIAKARAVLGYAPRVTLDEGLREIGQRYRAEARA